MAEQEPITITIGDQLLRVRAESGERGRYEKAARRINTILEDLTANGVVGGPRLMAMVAFELGVTLEETIEQLQRSLAAEREARDRLEQIIRRIETRIEIVPDPK